MNVASFEALWRPLPPIPATNNHHSCTLTGAQLELVSPKFHFLTPLVYFNSSCDLADSLTVEYITISVMHSSFSQRVLLRDLDSDDLFLYFPQNNFWQKQFRVRFFIMWTLCSWNFQNLNTVLHLLNFKGNLTGTTILLLRTLYKTHMHPWIYFTEIGGVKIKRSIDWNQENKVYG